MKKSKSKSQKNKLLAVVIILVSSALIYSLYTSIVHTPSVNKVGFGEVGGGLTKKTNKQVRENISTKLMNFWRNNNK